MNDPLNEEYCCCQVFHLVHGIFLIAVHSFFQGTYGILIVVTSFYKNKDAIVNTIAIAGNICLFPAGILVFGTTLYDSHQAAKFSAFLFTVITLFNFCATICYIFWYSDFQANSQLDKILYWRNDHDWVASGELPFTIWHILAFSNAIIFLVWWYYSFQLWKYAKIVKEKNKLDIGEYEARNLSFWKRRRQSSY